jgi:hypothetical protein
MEEPGSGQMYFYDEHAKIISTLRFKSNGAFAEMR